MSPTALADHSFKPLAPPCKRFSMEEANRAIVYVGRVAHDVVVTHCQVVSIRRQIEGARGGRLEVLERDYRGLINRLRELVRELDFAGVELRDFEKGTLEFPGLWSGQPVFFAWTPGQPAVQVPALALCPAPQAAVGVAV